VNKQRNIFSQHVVFKARQAPGTPQKTFLCAFAPLNCCNLFTYIQLHQKPFGTNLHESARIGTNWHQSGRFGPFRHAPALSGPIWAVSAPSSATPRSTRKKTGALHPEERPEASANYWFKATKLISFTGSYQTRIRRSVVGGLSARIRCCRSLYPIVKGSRNPWVWSSYLIIHFILIRGLTNRFFSQKFFRSDSPTKLFRRTEIPGILSILPNRYDPYGRSNVMLQEMNL
jgi:hypothetical protein